MPVLIFILLFIPTLSPAQTSWVRVPGGTHVPLFAAPDAPPSTVAPFEISRRAITNGEYLAFVRARPEWRKSAVRRLFADAEYLSHWESDLHLGPEAPPDAPVVLVSWFAARAYAAWAGGRLPTLLEWELVAAVGERSLVGADEPGFTARLLSWYSRRDPLQHTRRSACSLWGVCEVHGRIWEWVEDFDSVLVTGDSRNAEDSKRSLFCGGASISASDATDYAAFIRYAFRSGLRASYTMPLLGFRIARNLQPL